MPPKGRKRKSEEQSAPEMADQKIPVKTGSPAESPRKRRRVGITVGQKQALIDNLQLELTERARKLRAQYNLQAQGLRTRIEIRVNRIPIALRKLKMGDLLQSYVSGKPLAKPPAAVVAAAMMARPPPVPEKDYHSVRSTAASHRQHSPAPAPTQPPAPRAGPGRPLKRSSDEMASGDKENYDAGIENPKKRFRGRLPGEAGPDPSKVLSPTSSNSRLNARERPVSPTKSLIARPASPAKPASTNLLSNMVEKARSTRAAVTRKATTSSTASSAAGRAPAMKTRKAAAAPAVITKAPATRTTRRISGISESSDGSTATVVRKTGARAATSTTRAAAQPAAPAPAAKRTVMNTLKKRVTSAGTKKTAAAKTTQPAATAATATTRSGRVLRKRN